MECEGVGIEHSTVREKLRLICFAFLGLEMWILRATDGNEPASRISSKMKGERILWTIVAMRWITFTLDCNYEKHSDHRILLVIVCMCDRM